MDPDACLARYESAKADNDREEARAARADLLEWLHRGGFEPTWTETTTRAAFLKGTR